MLDGKQVRAARVFANWDAEELAARARLHKESILNIERGLSVMRGDTEKKIVRAFGIVGIEFIENQGVRCKPNDVQIFKGAAQFDDFYDFIYDHLKHHGSEMCVSVTDERLLAKYRADPDLHRRRMTELKAKKDISFRVIAAEGEFKSDYATYKRKPKNHSAAPTSFYAFGDCIALISFVGQDAPKVVLVQDAALASAYKESFEIAWVSAEKPPKPRGK